MIFEVLFIVALIFWLAANEVKIGIVSHGILNAWRYCLHLQHDKLEWVAYQVLDVNDDRQNRFEVPTGNVTLIADGSVVVDDHAFVRDTGFEVDGTIRVKRLPGKCQVLSLHNALSNVGYYFTFVPKHGWYRLVPANRSQLLLHERIVVGMQVTTIVLASVSVSSIIRLMAMEASPRDYSFGPYWWLLLLSAIVTIMFGVAVFFGRRIPLPLIPEELEPVPCQNATSST